VATEYESLRLNVSLVDNVTSQLEKIRGSLASLGGGPAGLGMERLKARTAELTEQMKGLATGFEGGSAAALNVAKSLGLATAGVVALGVAVVKGVAGLNEYARGMQQLGNLARQTGIGAAQIREMSEALQRSGVAADRAQSNIAGLAHAMADISRVNSELRQNLLRGLQGDDRQAMEMLLGDLGRVANNPAAFATRVREALDNVYANVLERTKSSTRAAEARQRFAEAFGMPDLAQLRGEIASVTPAMEAMMTARIAQSEKLVEVTTQIGQSWGVISDSVSALATPAVTFVLRGFADVLRDVASEIQAAVEALRSFEPPEWLKTIGRVVGAGAQKTAEALSYAAGTTEGGGAGGATRRALGSAWNKLRGGGAPTGLEAAAAIPVPQFQTGGMIGAGEMGLVGEAGPELFAPGQSGAILPNWLLKLMVKHMGTYGLMAGLKMAVKDAEQGHTMRTRLRGMLGLEDPGEPAPWQAGGAWKRQAGGSVTGGGSYLVGEAGAELFMGGGGGQGGEGRRLISEQNRQMQELNANSEDQNAQMRALTEELQTLNAAIAGPGGAPAGGGGGGVRMAGLRGLPGFGGGGGGAYGGGGGYGGAGGGPGGPARISGFAGGGGGARGGGASGSWGASAYGGGTTPPSTGLDAGNQTGASPAATAGPAGDPNIPGALLETARTVALTGGPQALDKFMRDNGYPRNGAWCGQFAASVVKSQGLQPPKNPEVASNWRNWGEAVTGAPQPGDVAIRTGGRTGATGSHVTFVSGYDPQTGRISTIGGNQALSRAERARGLTGESRDMASRYEYRRAPGGGVKPYGSDVGGGAFAGGGGTSGGAGATGRFAAPAGGGGRGGRGDLFGERAPMLMRELQDDLGLTRDQAAGLVGNLGYESAGFKSLQEGAPIGGAAGGYGYAQWTGPRRTAFEKWARENQLDPSSHEANAGFLKHELTGSHAGFLAQLKGTKNLAEATRLTHEVYERPADVQPRYWGTRLPGGRQIKPYESAGGRLQYAQRAHGLDRSELDQTMAREVSHRVEGTGKLTVDVNAPAGTKVAAEGGGLFKQTEVNRQTQMTPAREGPTVAV